MKQTISEYDFIGAFDKMDRGNQFTYQGRKALFEYLTQYEEDTGEEIELDVIAICCDFTEYENLAEYNKDYEAVESVEDIADKTTVIRVDDEAFIIQAY